MVKITKQGENMTDQSMLEQKITAFAEMVRATGPGPWNHFTCRELEPIEDLLRFAGYVEEAEQVLGDHALGDDDEGDVHHELYRLLTSPEPVKGVADSSNRDASFRTIKGE
jgi:hypothetical protein